MYIYEVATISSIYMGWLRLVTGTWEKSSFEKKKKKKTHEHWLCAFERASQIAVGLFPHVPVTNRSHPIYILLCSFFSFFSRKSFVNCIGFALSKELRKLPLQVKLIVKYN